MFSIAALNFLKVRKTTTVPSVPEFREVRHLSSLAWHIVDENNHVLCGNENCMTWEARTEVTAESISSTLDRQHEGWFWCGVCASQVTGLPAEEIRAARQR